MRARLPGILCMLLGLALLGSALWLAMSNLQQDRQAGDTAAAALQQLQLHLDSLPDAAPSVSDSTAPIRIPDHLRDPDTPMPTVTVDGQDYIGVVDIPALGLSLPVISEWSYPRLTVAPCRYQGSAYLNNMIIMAHNYRYHFGSLLSLSIGDGVFFTDAAGNGFAYEVVEVLVLEEDAVESMTAGDWDLTLFTCTLGGATRATVRCARVTD